MDQILDQVLDFIQKLDTKYIIIGIVAILMLLIILFILKSMKKNKKEVIQEEPEIKSSTTQVYNPLKNKEKEVIQSNLTIQNTSNDKSKNKKTKKKKEKKLSKSEKEFLNEKQICIDAYNNLYNIYLREGYSVDLTQNSLLYYFTTKIQEAQSSVELRDISTEISFRTQQVIDEIECAKKKYYLEQERKKLYDECVIKLAELKNLYTILNYKGDQILKEINDRLLSNGMFAQIEDYQNIYNEIIQNIAFIKQKYKTTLDKIFAQDTNEIDVKLVESLKFLNCKIDEDDLKVIKSNYIALIKKYHPDSNNDSYASIDMSGKINEAYTYVQKALKEKQNKKEE